MMKKAVVLLSGGLDSVTTLAMAKSLGYQCYALSFDYGQLHGAELQAATWAAQAYGVLEHKIIHIGLDDIGGSALTDKNIPVPDTPGSGIPVTYVPARNTLFLAFALSWSEVLGGSDIYIGVNAVDYSGYPDCRPEFLQAFEKLANLATKAGVEGKPFHIHAPLIHLKKADIIREGLALGVDYSRTVSCYSADAGGLACGRCDACRFRAAGFAEVGISDPTRYRP